jgi:hypothetical protein
MRFRTIGVTSLTLFVAIAATQNAYGQEPSRLKGLTALAVHVDMKGDSTLSMTELETALERRFREAGITVVAGQAPRVFGTQGNLWANVTVLRPSPSSNQAMLHTQLRVYGSVVLAGSNERGEAITWETERLMVVAASDVNARLRENLDFLVEDFSKAYQSAHAR